MRANDGRNGPFHEHVFCSIASHDDGGSIKARGNNDINDDRDDDGFGTTMVTISFVSLCTTTQITAAVRMMAAWRTR